MRFRAPVLLVALAPLAACMDEPNVEFNMDDDSTFADAEVTYAADDEFATLTESGAVKLGLTSDRVYFTVSDAVREHVDEEIASGMKDNDSRIARSISGAVRRGVQSAMSIDIDYPLADIRDVDYRDGELVFDFVNEGDERGLENIDIDNEPITRSFTAEDAQAFVAAFRRVKAGESVRGENVTAKQPGSIEEKRPGAAESSDADSGGASF